MVVAPAKRRRVFPTLFIAAALAFCTLFGCSGDLADREAIERSLRGELQQIKDLDGSMTSRLAELLVLDSLSEIGLTGQGFLNAYLDGFDYRIDSVTIDDTQATVAVILTVKDYQDFLQRLDSQVDSLLAQYREDASNDPNAANAVREEGAEALRAKVASLVLQVLAETPLGSSTVSIIYHLQDDTWIPSDTALQELAGALLQARAEG